MSEQKAVVNMSDRAAKAGFLSRVGALQGPWEVAMKKHRPRRTLRANAFYWAAVVPAFQQFMRDNEQYFEAEEIHEFFLQKFAAKNVVDPGTGEVLSVIGQRSSKMDTERFGQFVNDCIGWMYDRFGVQLPDPEIYSMRESA